MKIVTLMWLLMWFATAVSAQTPGIPPPPPAPDELFRVASASDFIAIGTVTQSRGIRKRLSPEELKDDLGKALGGTLYIFQVERILCRKSDFRPGEVSSSSPRQFFIFQTRADFFKEESYEENRRYLIYLIPSPQQQELSTIYELNAKEVYYKAFEGKRGLIPLPDDHLPLVSKLSEFCAAVRPVGLQQKVRRLDVLTRSADPELRESARSAIQALQSRSR